MPGVDTSRLVTGGNEIADYLDEVIAYVQERVTEAVGAEQEQLLERFQEDARNEPRWESIAGDLDQWEDAHGNVIVGVSPMSEAYEAAQRAEYGDENYPPVPLLRMGMLSHAVDIGQSLSNQMRNSGL